MKLTSEVFSGILKPIASTIDALTTNNEEEMQAKAALLKATSEAQAKLFELQQKVILAEAQGESPLQRNWRPILMLTIVGIIANNFILAPYVAAIFDTTIYLDLPQSLWQLLMIGVGGYVVGRSTEKVVSTLKPPKPKE